MPLQSIELQNSNARALPELTQEKKTHTHTKRTREDLLWALKEIIDPNERMRTVMKPPTLGKGWEVSCANPHRCLSSFSKAA